MTANSVKWWAVITVLAFSSIGAAAEDGRLVEIVAGRDNTFHLAGQRSPVITAKAGELLKLRITAERGSESARDGAVHSLVIRDLREQGWDLRLSEGTKEYTVRAPHKTGEYLVECTVKCGRGHDDMHMKLVVGR